MRLKTLTSVTVVAFTLFAAIALAAQAPAPAAGGDVKVTVTYKGKGAVDAAHDILVFLFTDPKIDATSQPIAVRSVKENGGTATFSAITANPVYVVAVYDEKDNYDGRSGPPPDGTPLATYKVPASKDLPAAVVPGAKGAIKMTFDDTRRWPK
jgi:hypothetical protein